MKVTLHSKEKTRIGEADSGELLSEICMDEQLFLNMRCGGGGTCGGCLTTLRKGRFRCGKKDVNLVDGDKPVRALACTTKVLSDEAEVHIPTLSLIELSGKIADDFLLEDFHQDTQTKKFYITIPEATLAQNFSERELVERELAKHTSLKNLYLPLDAMRRLPAALADGKRKITVTIGRIRNYWFVINVQPGDETRHHLAVAIDIGTTTVAGILVDLYDGKILGRSSRYNQQITVADDVSSRISYCSSAAKVRTMQRLVVKDTINPILHELCHDTGFETQDISRMAICGNTVMMHLLLGLNPESIGKMPFNAVTLVPGEYLAKDIGLDMNENGIADMIPSISGYVGGDITADIYVAKMQEKPGVSVLVDIGTNGEMVVCRDGKISVCATPAGPSFEGAGLYHGCRASYGAIERVRIDTQDNITIEIIGDTEAKGICGSAIIDFIAQARKVGLLNAMGRFDIARLKAKGVYAQVAHDDKEIHACVLVAASASALDEAIVVTIGVQEFPPIPGHKPS